MPSVYDAYDAYGHIVSIGMKWSCVLVTQTPRERSSPHNVGRA